MSYMDFNGLVLSVDVRQSPSISRLEEGYRDRSATNQPRKTVHGKRDVWSVNTSLLPQADAHALRSFLQGIGWSWSFNEGLWAEQSNLGPENDYDVTLGFSSGLNGGAMNVPAGAGTSITYAPGLGSRWGVLIRVQHSDNSWHMLGQDDAGTQWEDGVSGTYAYLTSLLTVASGSVSLAGYNESDVAAAMWVDQMVIFPWRPASKMFEGWTADTSPFSQLPLLRVGGDWNVDAPLHVSTDQVSGSYAARNSDAAAQAVSFSMTEQPYVS